MEKDQPPANQASPLKEPGIMLNIDINSVVTPFLNNTARKPVVHEQELHPFIDQYAKTGITDLALDVFCQFSNTPSKIFTDGVAKYLQKSENGLPVDYTDRYEGLYRITTYFNLDIYDVWFKRCRALGMRAWLSVRMNDAHCPDDDVSFLRSDFFYSARQKGWMIGPKFGYYRHCYDYAVPEIRQMMLDYITEQLDRYDVDGLELDWLREIYCFDTDRTPDAVKIMNDFMCQVKAIVIQAERKRGHRIYILCRLTRDVKQSLSLGFDALTWTQEHWVDVLVVSPRWATCDSDMPLDQWLPLCQSTALWAGLEILVNQQKPQAMATAEVARGYAAQYLAAGADKIYLYNYYQDPYHPVANLEECYRTCGNRDMLQTLPRRHIVTWQDLCPPGFKSYQPLPVTLQPGDETQIDMATGPIPSSADVRVIVGGKSDLNRSIHVYVNQNPCQNAVATNIQSFNEANRQIEQNGYIDEDSHLYAYRVKNQLSHHAQSIRIKNADSQPVELTYLEIDIR